MDRADRARYAADRTMRTADFRIVLATDGSPQARAAVATVVAVQWPAGTQVRAVFARQKNHLSASYDGAEHRLYVTPIDGIERCPWTLIVFRNLAPRRAQQLETILLFCCLTGGY